MIKTVSLLAFLPLLLGCSLLFDREPTNTIVPKNLLLVEQSDYDGSSSQMVDMSFPPPKEIGAESYTLQYSVDGNTPWQPVQFYGEDLRTSNDETDNFSIDPHGSYYLRLLISGGEFDGQHSNKTYVPLSTVETYFQQWGMMPTSTGFEASFVVKRVSDATVVEDALAYIWYRVDPLDYEQMTLIEGATLRVYDTVPEDKGYRLLIRATGDGTNAGGFIQMMTDTIR